MLSLLLYSGTFRVPWHQRSYDWDAKTEVDDLLNDLKDAFDAGKKCYFLGSIMLLEAEGTKPRRINDGQQRFITFSLIMAAFARHFRGEDSNRESLAVRILFDRPEHKTSRLADASLYQPRITPPKNDRHKYRNLIRGHEIGVDGLLKKAWRKINSFVRGLDGETSEGFFDFLMDKVEVSVLDVPHDVDANRVFETLNARGKSLDAVDLIRNLLYSHFSEGEDARRDTVHANLQYPGAVLGRKHSVSEYFRCYLRSRYGHLHEKHFYREVRKQIELETRDAVSPDYAYDLVEGLGREDSIELFRTIKSAKPGELEGHLPKISGKRNLTILLGELKGYSVSRPLCFALLHRFISEDDPQRREATGRVVARSLRNLTSFIMRSVFATARSGFRPSRIAEPIANCAARVFRGSDLESLEIMDDLIYADKRAFRVINDESFKQVMTDMKTGSANKAVQYLFGINAQNQAASDSLTISGCSLEHVLPESDKHWQGWTGFENDSPEDWVHRLGNLTLLSRRENRGRDRFNASFTAKKPFFANSTFLMTRDIAEKYDDWSPQIIQARSRRLARDAARIWSFSHTG